MTEADAIAYAEDKGIEDGTCGRGYAPPFHDGFPDLVAAYCSSYWLAVVMTGPLASEIDVEAL